MEDHKCNQNQRLNAIEADIKELKESTKYHSTEIATLKESHAETKVYVKQILSRIDDLRDMFTSATSAIQKEKKDEGEKGERGEKLWAQHSAELVRLIVAITCILAGVKYFKI